MFVLHSYFEILKNKKKKLFCAFVDFEKAFDTVWHDALWYKMLLNNINGNMYQVIFNMHQNIKSCLFYNGNKSEYFPCEIGVRKGENLSPFIFSLFLNDLEDFLIHENVLGLNSISDQLDSRLDIFMKLFIILYADNTVLMAESSSNLQTLLDQFYLYCDTWKMKINVDKTKIVVFSKGQLPRNLIFNYNGTNIEIVKDFNYLGIYFSWTGSFKVCKYHLSEKLLKLCTK
jgi:hypothetical protein